MAPRLSPAKQRGISTGAPDRASVRFTRSTREGSKLRASLQDALRTEPERDRGAWFGKGERLVWQRCPMWGATTPCHRAMAPLMRNANAWTCFDPESWMAKVAHGTFDASSPSSVRSVGGPRKA
jgi:hypothetical protein